MIHSHGALDDCLTFCGAARDVSGEKTRGSVVVGDVGVVVVVSPRASVVDGVEALPCVVVVEAIVLRSATDAVLRSAVVVGVVPFGPVGPCGPDGLFRGFVVVAGGLCPRVVVGGEGGVRVVVPGPVSPAVVVVSSIGAVGSVVVVVSGTFAYCGTTVGSYTS